MDDGQMTAQMTVLVTALAVLLAVVSVLALVLAVQLVGARRRERAAYEERVRLEAELARSERAAVPAVAEPVEGYLITDIGRDPATVPGVPVADRAVVSAVLGEPLLKAAAFAHGLRRALAPETRHRIAFTVRREVKRSRKERRREMRTAWRESRAQSRAQARAEERSRTAQDAA